MAAGSPMRYSSIGCAARDISQVLSMTIDEAAAFFTESRCDRF